MHLLAQATQPAADPYGWIDKLAALLVALTGLVTAVVAVWRSSRNAGHLSSLGQQVQQVQATQNAVLLNTPAPTQTPPPGAGVTAPGLINPFDRPGGQ